MGKEGATSQEEAEACDDNREMGRQTWKRRREEKEAGNVEMSIREMEADSQRG